jgi:hypothetical protein
VTFLDNPAAAAEFWRTCCERGIAIFEGPMPFQEHKEAWFVQKNSTIVDKKTWNSSYSYSDFDLVIQAVIGYFKSGEEPKVERRQAEKSI